jgi:UTP--glucose-1-phosphate uridylyltransferase
MNAAVKKVVVPVAGLGTRGLPFTKEVPKELLPIIDTPTIHYIVEEVIAAGIEQVIFITSKGKSALEDYFDPSPTLESWLRKRGKDGLADRIRDIGTMCEIVTVRQKEPLGLGHAIYCARDVVGKDKFAVCLGDEIFPSWDLGGKAPLLKRLIESSVEVKASVVGVVEIPKTDSTSYGIIDVSGKKLSETPAKVEKTVEKPKPEQAPSNYAIIGRYVFEPILFDALKETKPGVGGEIQLTDAMDRLCREGKLYALLGNDRRYDVGNHFFYVKAVIDAALMRPEIAPRLKDYLKTLS